MRKLVAILLLTGVYLLALASADPLDALTGVLISAAVVFGFGRFLWDETGESTAPPLLVRAAAFPLFAAAVIREITVGTWQVSLIVLGIRPLSRPGIVQIPIGERTPTGVAATALAITLSPGELLVEIDETEEVMLIHVLDASDPDEIRRRYDRFFNRYQRRVFP